MSDTPTTSPSLPDAAAIRRLVEEVLRRVGTLAADGRAPAQAAVPAAVAPAPLAASTPAITVPDAVVTEAVIAALPGGTRRVAIAPRAVVTPSARDAAAAAGIALERKTSAPAGQAARPFVVAHAACPGDAAGRAAAVARAVPGAQQLPASGLADVVAAIALFASREGARGILLTGKPAAAVVLANRSPGLRAVTARDPRTLAAAAAESAANLLVLDPGGFAPGTLERTCAEFARSPAVAIPAELAAPTPGCACRGHAH